MDQYIDRTGLDMDCINIWSNLDTLHDLNREGGLTLERFKERLSKPVRTYYQYLVEQYPKEIKEHKSRAQQGLTEVFDSIVNEYNTLSLDEKMQDDAHRPFRERCRQIILGQTSE
jgi:hypothetical protein